MRHSRNAALAVCVALASCAFLAFATLVQAASFNRRASTATVQACTNIRKAIGDQKVVSNRLDFSYLTTVSVYYNQLQSKNFPACVVYPTVAKDVQVAIAEIRKANARFAVKSGGHNFNSPWSSVDQGVQIDFVRMKGKSYDASTGIGYIEPGNRWRDSYRFFEQYGVAPVGGRLGGVGTGLLLGGGLSYLSSQYGLGCDSYVKLDVVLPDGSFVQATRDNEYKDLFLTLQGGGNIIGVVTGYHLKLRPTGVFYSGNIAYSPDHGEAIANAARDFTINNKDPKASIIVTVNKLPTPDATVGLDEFILLFAVYDGPDAGNAFEAFEKVPHVIDTRQKRSYTDTTLFLDAGTLSFGAYYSRVVAIRLDGSKHLDILAAYRKFAAEFKGQYIFTTLDYQPVPKLLTDASKAEGGNAIVLPDGPYIWLNLLLAFDPNAPKAVQDRLRAGWDKMADSVPNDSGLPLFLNDAGSQQKNVLPLYGKYAEMQAAKRRLDPTNFFSTNQDGPFIQV